MSPLTVALAGLAYGVARPIVGNVLPDFFNVGPVSSDNAIIAGAGYMGMKKGKGFVKALSMVALSGEMAQVSAKATTNFTLGGSATGGQTIDLNKINY